MHKEVDKFIKVSKKWTQEISALREILLTTKLEEEFKWKLPCYTYEGANIVIIQPFKASLALMFFKGALLKDTKKLLSVIGPNSQVGKRFEFHSVQEIKKLSPVIRSYIKEAIKIEESGQKVVVDNQSQEIPVELKKAFSKNPKLKKAFNALTPGRQRAYIFHFSSAKQATTRQARIEKYIPHILDGRGINDR